MLKNKILLAAAFGLMTSSINQVDAFSFGKLLGAVKKAGSVVKSAANSSIGQSIRHRAEGLVHQQISSRFGSDAAEMFRAGTSAFEKAAFHQKEAEDHGRLAEEHLHEQSNALGQYNQAMQDGDEEGASIWQRKASYHEHKHNIHRGEAEFHLQHHQHHMREHNESEKRYAPNRREYTN